MYPRLLSPDVADSFRRDAVLGCKKCGSVLRFSPPQHEDADRLFRAQPGPPDSPNLGLEVLVSIDRTRSWGARCVLQWHALEHAICDALGSLGLKLASLLCLEREACGVARCLELRVIRCAGVDKGEAAWCGARSLEFPVVVGEGVDKEEAVCCVARCLELFVVVGKGVHKGDSRVQQLNRIKL